MESEAMNDRIKAVLAASKTLVSATSALTIADADEMGESALVMVNEARKHAEALGLRVAEMERKAAPERPRPP